MKPYSLKKKSLNYMPTTGLHHITAVAGNPQQNLDFYSGLLGFRLIKKTVNIDDASTYHLFYGNGEGAPGSILSFFASSQMSQGEPDTGSGVAVGLAIPATSVDFWADYLKKQGVDYVEPFERFGKLVIGLQDPDGLYLELIGAPGPSSPKGWDGGPIPAEHAIRGLHGITLAEESYQGCGQLLTESLGFEEIAEEHDRYLYRADTDIGNTVELIDGAELNGKPGKGTVHHITFRAEDMKQQKAIRDDLEAIGYHLTDTEDRYYFQSFFFHEPGGALLEVATDEPGFTVDEEPEHLGKTLSLHPNIENRRSLIEADLPTLNY